MIRKILLLLIICIFYKSSIAEIQNVDSLNKYNYADSLRSVIDQSDNDHKARLYHELAFHYYRNDSLALGFKFQVLSQDLANETEDNTLKVNNYFLAGEIYRVWGDYSNALEQYYQSLNTNRRGDDIDTSSLIKTLCAISQTYSFSKNYKDAIKYGNEVVKIALLQGDSIDIGKSYSALGISYGMSKDYDNALNNYQNALKYLDITKPISKLIALYNSIGIVYVERSDFEQAEYYYQKALSLLSQMELSDRYESGILLGFAYMYTKMGDNKKAMVYLSKCEKRLEGTDQLYYLGQVYNRFSNLYASEGNYKTAFEYKQLYIDVKDISFSERKEKELNKVKLFQWVEKRKRELETIEREAKIMKLVSFSALFLLIIIIILIFQKYKNTKLKLALKEEERLNIQSKFEKKNRELVSMAMNVSHKKKLMKQFDEFFKDIQKEVKKPKVLKLIKDQRNILISNTFYDQFEESFSKHFEDVHPNFFNYLRQHHVKLTHNDLIHCAYIKLQLQSQEIATIQNITERSVQMTRYRLKKKLGFDKDDDLSAYLHSI